MVNIRNEIEMNIMVIDHIQSADDNQTQKQQENIGNDLLLQKEFRYQEKVIEVKITGRKYKHGISENKEPLLPFTIFHKQERNKEECCPDQQMDENGKKTGS